MRLLEEGLHTANIYFPETVSNITLQLTIPKTSGHSIRNDELLQVCPVVQVISCTDCYPAPIKNNTLQLKSFAIVLSIDIVVSVKRFVLIFLLRR